MFRKNRKVLTLIGEQCQSPHKHFNRRPPNPNNIELQKADAVSYRNKTDATRLPIFETSKANHPVTKMVKIQIKLECQTAAIYERRSEQEVIHDTKRAETLAQAAAANREYRSELKTLRRGFTLAEKQSAKQASTKVKKKADNQSEAQSAAGLADKRAVKQAAAKVHQEAEQARSNCALAKREATKDQRESKQVESR